MIGYYGGSFNPVHLGHIQVANYILNNKFVEKICLTPAISHPFDKNMASFQNRIEMLEIACKDFKNIEPSKVETYNKGKKSYTIDLLKHISKNENEFFFIAGLDNFNDFFKWKSYEEILKNYNIVFTTRAGFKIDLDIKLEMENIIGKEVEFCELEKLKPTGVSFLKVPDYFIASQNIREMLMDKKKCSGIIHKEVLDYIKHHNLY